MAICIHFIQTKNLLFLKKNRNRVNILSYSKKKVQKNKRYAQLSLNS